MPLLPYQGRLPRLAEDVFVAPNAYLIGEVEAEEGANIWFGCTLRGDLSAIKLGPRVNIQENCVLHGNRAYPTILGEGVVLGHNATVHGSVVEAHVMVAIGATVLGRCTIGSGSIIAAHAVVPEGTEVPPRSMVMGIPGRVVRQVTEQEFQRILRTRENYDRLAREYRETIGRGW